MTSPADIYDQALERLSATNLSDEVEDINLGGTMLQAANESMPNPLGRQVSGTTFDGGRHAKSSLDSIEQHVTPRRRQQEPASTAVAPCISESGLTRQATNNTRVTARRDGQSFRQIEAEANEEVRRIVRGQPKAHRLQRDYNGIGPGASITPRCDCGWSGRPCFETDGAMMSRLEAQEDAHRASILHERVFGGDAA